MEDKRLEEMILEAIAERTPFSYREIAYAHRILESIDLVIAATEMAIKNGTSLGYAVYAIHTKGKPDETQPATPARVHRKRRTA